MKLADIKEMTYAKGDNCYVWNLSRTDRASKRTTRTGQLLGEIQINLHQMKMIAQYAADYKLSAKKLTQLNKKILEHQSTIKELESKIALLH